MAVSKSRRRSPAAPRASAGVKTWPSAAFRGHLTLETPLGAVLSEGRIRLLEAIDKFGSLNSAARHVPLSYKAAWDALDSMNRLAPEPLVQRAAGGVGGGGTRLTDYGHQVVSLYRAMESSQQDILDRLKHTPPDADTPALRTLIKRLTMRSSARNQWKTQVAGLVDHGGLVDVVLKIGEDPRTSDQIIATVTPESAQSMALSMGSEVFALVKAPTISVTRSDPGSSPGVNVLQGVVTALRAGEHSTGVELGLRSGQTLHAVIDNALAHALGVGEPAWAVFPGDHVVLVIFF